MAKPLVNLVVRLTPKRRWAQFSLGTLFLVVSALCVWLALVVNRAQRQRDAVAAIEALGGTVEYAAPNEGLPETFLRRWLPRDYLDEVQTVSLRFTGVTDSGLVNLRALTRLQGLSLDNTKVTDAGLADLQSLTGLRWLLLGHTHVTDAGLAHLKRLTRLQRIFLDGTQVTDAGVAHLHGLTELKELNILGTQITDGGVIQLRQALPRCHISGP